MGGYGALLYSTAESLCISTRCIAVGVNTPLNLPKTISIKNYTGINEKDGASCLSNISTSMFNKQYSIYFGEFDVSDAYSSLFLRDMIGDKVNIFSHAGATHNIPVHLDIHQNLANAMQSMLSGTFNFPGRGKAAELLTSADLKPLPFFSPTINQTSEIEYLESLVEKYPSYAFALNRIGAYWHNRGNLDLALDYLKRSWEAGPCSENTNHHLSLIFEKLGLLDESFSHAIMAAKSLPSNSNKSQLEKVKQRLNFTHSPAVQ